MASEFQMPFRWSRLAPCKERDCGHESCDRLRLIAASPCLLCRKAIGYGLVILDERTQEQRDREVYDVGFVHKTCRKRWKQRFMPEARTTKPHTREQRPPAKPLPVHLDDGAPPKRRSARKNGK